MTGRSTFFAAAAIAALVAGAGAASAQGFGGSFYLKGFGGATWPSGEENELQFLGGGTDIDVKLDYDTGYVLGAAVGYDYTPNFGLELEYAYRDADTTTDLSGIGESGGSTNSNAVMLNALYKFDGMGAGGAVQPYVGGGLGWANMESDIDDIGSFKRDNAFAWQLIGGVGYAVNPSWDIIGEVRYFATDSGTLSGPGNLSWESQVETVDLLLGAVYKF